MIDLEELEKLSIFLETKAQAYSSAKSYVKGKNAEKFEQLSEEYRRL